MKKLLFLLPLIVLSAATPTDSQKIDIDEAMRTGLVKVEAISNGMFHDESVQLTIHNLKGTKYIVRIPPAFLFHPEDPGEQTLITTEEQFLVVNAHGTGSKLMKAYCSERSDRCPTENSTFEPVQSNHPNMIKLTDYVRTHPVSQGCLQDAIWSVLDGSPLSNIVTETPEDIAFRNYLSTLTGQENPWYTSPQNREVLNDGSIVSNTVKINGEMRIDVPTNCQIYQEIKDKNGISKMKGSRLLSMPKGDNIRFTFRIEVTGWKKGEYDVFLMTSEQVELAHYSFSV